MTEGLDDRLRRVERKLGITDEQDTTEHIIRLARQIERLSNRVEALEQRISGNHNLDTMGAAVRSDDIQRYNPTPKERY